MIFNSRRLDSRFKAEFEGGVDIDRFETGAKNKKNKNSRNFSKLIDCLKARR